MARSHMNMPIICVRSFCGVNEVPDFTNCKRVPGRAYNGANGKKIAIEYQGEQYMLKFPPSGQGKRTELSYTNSCISEHIASTIFNMVGIPAQETILGTYDVGGKTKIVCACKDFLQTEVSCLTSAPSRIPSSILNMAAPERSWRTFWIPLKNSST